MFTLRDLLKKLGLIKSEIPKYGLLYFDHLQGEIVMIRDLMSAPQIQICSAIESKRQDETITWNDIYSYQLILLEYQDFETLKSKIISLRVKYQNLVDIAEYNSYISMRAIDLTKQLGDADIDSLRADFKYLLDEFYLRYAYVSTREELRTKLLRYGALLTFFFFFLASVVGTVAGLTKNPTMLYIKDTFSIVFIVAFAGIMGAFVSMQQRLQSLSNQGDPIHNLSLLTHGWFSIFLSPMSGAIFAVILYLFFAGGLLKGTIFPEMKTPQTPETLINVFGETRPTAANANPANVNLNPANVNSNSANDNSSNSQTNISVSPPTQTIETTQETVLGLTYFLAETGPLTGTSFALLIIWSFIAGFAERFVPDTLMRLVSQKKPGDTPSA